jgi:hypothetical protein
MILTFTQSWTRSETVQTRVGVLTNDPLEVNVVPTAPPHSPPAVPRLERILTAAATPPNMTDD